MGFAVHVLIVFDSGYIPWLEVLVGQVNSSSDSVIGIHCFRPAFGHAASMIATVACPLSLRYGKWRRPAALINLATLEATLLPWSRSRNACYETFSKLLK